MIDLINKLWDWWFKHPIRSSIIKGIIYGFIIYAIIIEYTFYKLTTIKNFSSF